MLFCSCVFSPFSIGITSLGEERASLAAFRAFVRFCACLVLSVSSSSWCLGRDAFLIVALGGLFSYPFLVFRNANNVIKAVCRLKMSQNLTSVSCPLH